MRDGLTVPLACLLAFVAWIVVLVIALTIARFHHLGHGGTVREFGIPDDRRLIWRLFRAHVNAVENLPLFAAVVLVAAAAGRQSRWLDVLAVIYLCARIGQSVSHVTRGAGVRFHVRFGFFVVQLVCLVAFVAVLAVP